MRVPQKEFGTSKPDEIRLQKEVSTLDVQVAKKQQKTEDLKTVHQLCKAHGFTANMLKNYLASGRTRKPRTAKK